MASRKASCAHSGGGAALDSYNFQMKFDHDGSRLFSVNTNSNILWRI